VNTKGRRLGRGLEALLGREEGGFEPGSFEGAELVQVAVDQVDPNPFQPRRHFDSDEIKALADSLRQHGMIQPIIVRAVGLRYQLIAGERRLRASIEAQLHEIPARVLDLDDQRVFELAMVENLQREDLNAIDKGSAFRDYLARYGGTQEELAGRLGIDRSTVSNLIRLLELPEEIQGAVRVNKITQGHARALLGLEQSELRIDAYRRVVTEHLSVRQTEALVSTGVPTPSRPRIRKDPAHEPGVRAPHLLELEQALHRQLSTSVAVRSRSADRGQIVIDYHSREELDRLTRFFGVEIPPPDPAESLPAPETP
jgi:ParB family transcriptional regulator, chromosome partitioning protein